MKILFSIYSEDYETEEKNLLYSRVVNTDMSINDVNTLLQLHEGFHSVLEVGHHLCFWDIYCFFSNTDDLQQKISTIPLNSTPAKNSRLPNVLIIEQFNPGNADNAFLPDIDDCFAYRLTRYECGASSFDAIVMFASSHPWLMVFIGGALWDCTKFLGSRLRKILKRRFGLVDKNGFQKRVACLSINRFYRNFSNATKIPVDDFQIVFLNRRKNNVYDVRVRTANNECFHVKCSGRGQISSIKLVDINSLHGR